jgi:hypothetical protein
VGGRNKRIRMALYGGDSYFSVILPCKNNSGDWRILQAVEMAGKKEQEREKLIDEHISRGKEVRIREIAKRSL